MFGSLDLTGLAILVASGAVGLQGGEREVQGEIEVRGPRSSYSPTIGQRNSLIVVIDVTESTM